MRGSPLLRQSGRITESPAVFLIYGVVGICAEPFIQVMLLNIQGPKKHSSYVQYAVKVVDIRGHPI